MKSAQRFLACLLFLGAASCNSSSDPTDIIDASTLDTSDDGATLDAADIERDESTPDVGEDTEIDVVVPPGCGDGELGDGEECDNGDDNGNGPDQCRPDCTLPVCGDGIIDTGEACDDGGENSDTDADACRLDCALPVCGDGVVDSGEGCDDGNNDDSDACAGCEPTGDFLCATCESDDDCGLGAVCFPFDDGSACVPTCADTFTCPESTTCSDTEFGSLCLPDTGSCAGCIDGDGDGFGVGAGCAGSDCNDRDEAINPAAIEACDGVDNDCNPATADGLGDAFVGVLCDGDDDDLCASGATECQDGAVQCVETAEDGIELCDGIDNDCDPDTEDGSADSRLGTACDGDDSDLCAEGVFSCTATGLFCSDTTGDNIEVCDLIDNDCNGLPDDNAVNATVYYVDADGDGFGDDTTDFRSCVTPEGDFVTQGGDCNDLIFDINPGADELCDGLDNDCDDLPDNNAIDATAGFIDADGDGFGDDGSFSFFCELPENFVGVGGDCNDDANGVNPEATELCADTIDNDCNTAVDCADDACRSLDECRDFSCVDGVLDAVGPRAFVGSNAGAGDDAAASCVGNDGEDIALQWTVPATGFYTFDTRGSDFDTVLYLTDGACNGEQLACDDDIAGNNQDSEFSLPLEEGQELLIVLDAFGSGTGEVILNITVDIPEICDDDVDNNFDGAVDCEDADCFGVEVCVPDVCPDALATGLGEAVATGTTEAEEYFTACSPSGRADTVVAWTSEAANNYRFTLLSDDPEGSLAFLSACGGSVTCAGDDRSFGIFAFPGQQVLMLVEADGPYTINVAVDGEDCGDGIDNDLDGLTDCDDFESCTGDSACLIDECPSADLGSALGDAIATGNTSGFQNLTNGTCASNNGPEATFLWTAPLAGTYEFNTLGSTFDTMIYLLDECGGTELVCNDDGFTGGERLRSIVSRTFAAGESVIVNVGGFGSSAGNFELNIQGVETCNDGIDNTGNGLVDCEDPSCSDVAGCFEICGDGIDNDDNGRTDCADAACFGLEECDEICDDGIDNNFDDLTDCEDAVCIPTEVCCMPDVFEPNAGVTGSPSTLLQAFLDAGSPAMTLPSGDTDSFRVNTCVGAVITATATHAVADGNIDIRALNPFVQLLGVAESTDDNETLVVTADQPTVFVQLYENNPELAVCASYELSIDVDESGCAE